MAKDLSLMEITVRVPTSRVHEVASWLEDNGAASMMVKAYRNGASPKPAAARPQKTVPQKNGGLNLKQIGEGQQKWLEGLQGSFTTQEILDEWAKAGWQRSSIYGAIYRAVKRGALKKTGPGKYLRVVREKQHG